MARGRRRRRRRYQRAIKRNPIVAWFLGFLWPRATVNHNNAHVSRVERFQTIGFALALLAALVATTTFLLTQDAEGATPADVAADAPAE